MALIVVLAGLSALSLAQSDAAWRKQVQNAAKDVAKAARKQPPEYAAYTLLYLSDVLKLQVPDLSDSYLQGIIKSIRTEKSKITFGGNTYDPRGGEYGALVDHFVTNHEVERAFDFLAEARAKGIDDVDVPRDSLDDLAQKNMQRAIQVSRKLAAKPVISLRNIQAITAVIPRIALHDTDSARRIAETVIERIPKSAEADIEVLTVDFAPNGHALKTSKTVDSLLFPFTSYLL
ncbi:MAG TPA: hypothetical protein VNI20_04345, partial [Fimbriimonadaceae bacterium]|nr:hypothetical protein [Fimbriimonadaceae bacterium]